MESKIKTKISVIMPVFNTEEAYLREAIESIINQTIKDFEFIIINDCSKTDVESVILSYNDDRIKYLKNEENQGVSKTSNKALIEAKGKYVARIDSDDVAMPERLQKQFEFLENNPDYQLCSTRITKAKKKASPRSQNFEYQKAKLLFRGNPIIQPTVMFNRDFFIKNELFYIDAPYSEDWDMWLRLSMIGKFSVLPERLLFYRIHDNQANKIFADKHFEYTKKHYEKMLNLIGFKTKPETKKELINFLSSAYEKRLTFKEWGNLLKEVIRLLAYVKKSSVANYRYSFMILLQKFISYSKKTTKLKNAN